MTLGIFRSALLPAACALLLTVHRGDTPDEGQWLPQQIRAMNWTALQARGMQLSRDEFWHPEKGGVLSAAVQIGGCTASFCSPDGLVVTNHHCGFGAVTQLSTTENNYLRDGFVAGSREQELPAPGMVVYIVRRIENVTDRVHAAQAAATNATERWMATRQVIAELVAEGEQEPDTDCSVASFFEGREYHRYYRTRLTDVRLVYAPPRAIGEYGGEVDNWEWPRHTGDFTFFRAYAAPDGTPRGYDEDNVPFRPEHYLRVSADGVQENDLVVIMGYPGSTDRYMTSAAVANQEGVFYPMRLELLTDVLEVMESHASKSDQNQLDYASLIKSLANVQKNASGMVWGLARNGVVARKQAEEAAFRSWIAESAERQAAHGTVLDELLALDHESARTTQKDLVLWLLMSGRVNPAFAALADLVRQASMREAAGESLPRGLARRVASDGFMKDFDTVQRPILVRLLDEVRHLSGDSALTGRETLQPELDVPTEQVVRDMLGASQLMNADGRLALLRGGRNAVQNSKDPLVRLLAGMNLEAAERSRRRIEDEGRRMLLGRRWIEAQQAWRGTSFYPDANSTMRASIASVKGYEPRDGMRYVPHTTVDGLLRKHTGSEPFAAPEALLEAAENRSGSRFFDARIGDVPVCFLADGDTTGGNSGSPVVNGKGELVGLNFDRAFESVSGDYGWNPDRSRNISVDIRYVLWCLESVMPAPHLLSEMGVGAPATR